MFTQLPAWDSIHPLVVHFPIVLTLIAPIFIVLGLIVRKHARVLAVCALALMVAGAVGAVLAASSGEAGAERAENVPGVEAVLEEHEELAETARTLLVVSTIVYALIVAAPLAFKRILDPAPSIVLNGAFLILYAIAATYLVNTAHQGGMLVHQYGVHAMLSPGAQAAAETREDETEHEEDE